MDNTPMELKGLRLNINEELHKEIKIRASFRGMTMKKWIINAIIEQIKLEEKFN